jgi:phenylacetate-CoA ligase
VYWNEHSECMPKEQLRELQTRRLQKTVYHVYQNVPFYRKKMQEMGLCPEDIKSIDDVSLLPFTTKDDLRNNYPYGLFAVPMSEIIRIHASSGTTGKPTVVGYTRNDITNWAEAAARALVAAGGDKHAEVQVAYGYGLFTGGLGMHYGVEKLGASAIPISGGNTKRQIMIMKDFGSTILCCTPSYALFLAETMEEMGIKPEELELKAAILGAEPWSEEMRRDIERRLGILTIDIYGLSEISGPGVACECSCQADMHVNEDMFYPEIIDPATGEVQPDCTPGELVFTTIAKEGIPLLRYRTRDISTLTHAPCSCGRTFVRMHRVMGRSDDMLIIRGVNVFPTQIESVLDTFEELSLNYVIVVTREKSVDQLEVRVELSENLYSDEIKEIEKLQRRIAAEIHAVLNIHAKVTLMGPKTIERSEGKAKRVIDLRTI